MDTAPTRAQLIEKFRECGINPTQQRLAIAQILFARPQHLSAEQLLQSLQGDTTYVSKATVYNTLALFAEKGLVREVIVDPSKVFYDSNTHQHHHFYNVDTGALIDFNHADLALESLPQLPEGCEMDGVDIVIRVKQAAS
jgi:Fur family iron response transcriptional regulator